MLMWLKHTRLRIILPLNLVYGFFLQGLFLVKTPYLVSLTIHPLYNQEDLILKDSRGNIERLIASTFLDYEHRFIKHLHIIDNKSQI